MRRATLSVTRKSPRILAVRSGRDRRPPSRNHAIRLFGTTASGGFIGTTGPRHLVIPVDRSRKTLPTRQSARADPVSDPINSWPVRSRDYHCFANNFSVNDRAAIESALRRVQSGEISPEQATELLLAAENAEPLDSLIDRLGAPPEDIVNRWCDQLRSIASAHESESGQPLPEIELDQWAITLSGALLWQGRCYELSDDADKASQASLDRIQSFRRRWISELPVQPSARAAATIERAAGDDLSVTADPSLDRAEAKRKPGLLHSTLGKFSIVGIAVCLLTAAVILIRAVRPPAQSLAVRTDNPAASRTPSTVAAADLVDDPSNSSKIDSKRTQEAVSLETFEAIPKTETLQLESELSMPSDGLLSPVDRLDWLGTRESLDIDDPAAVPGSANPDPAASDDTKPIRPGGGRIDDDQFDAAEPAPGESPQQTRQSRVKAVDLGRIDDLDTPVSLTEHRLRGIKLDFPFEVPLQIRSEEQSWTVHDTRKGLVLATIRSRSEGTELSWKITAKQSAYATALWHGRITGTNGSTIFLRPTIEADPWRFRFDRYDVMPSWDLGHPIPPRVTRLAIDFELPSDVEFGWIEPVEAGQIRRTRAVAVVTPEGDEQISLGVRFDVRCNRKLSCRIRFAARLDPSMNWQLVSTPLLEQFADQLTNRAGLISNEATRLAKVYRAADTTVARRLVRAKEEQNEMLAKQVSTVAERVAKLQTLMTALESEAAIVFRVWVQWPDDEQEILTASGPEEDASEDLAAKSTAE